MATYNQEKALEKKIKRAQEKKLQILNQRRKEAQDSTSADQLALQLQDPENAANSERLFTSLKDISENTLKGIDRMGFKLMTDIQAKCIPDLLEGFNMVGTAKTGSGKTLAFLIPAIELAFKLEFKPRNGTCILIVTPTRELCLQTYGFLKELMRHHSQTFGLIMGGTNKRREVENLSKGINILVATPGRLLDHLKTAPNFIIKNLSCLIIDEVDQLFDSGFGEELKQILPYLPGHKQIVLFSATKDNKVNELLKLLRVKTKVVDIQSDKAEATPEGVKQAFLVCPAEKRFLILHSFLKLQPKAKIMVFFSSCSAVKFYHDLLNYIGVPVMFVHGNVKQNLRIRTFYRFCNLDAGILLCTNVAARGWDIPAVDLIIQYDPPNDPREYIHRVGRTARAGGKGEALLFILEEELGFISYLKLCKVNIDCMGIDESGLVETQEKVEKVVTSNLHLHPLAKEAFSSYVKAYSGHYMKKMFDISKLNLEKAAKSFGLLKPPFVNINLQSQSQYLCDREF